MGRVSKAMLLCLLMAVAPFAGCFGGDDEPAEEVYVWVDPVTEIEDENHSHSDLMAHRLQTPNVRLIDYHNLNCDGNVKPPAELDNVAGRPCDPAFKNVAPTPGDSSEISIEGNFMEDLSLIHI